MQEKILKMWRVRAYNSNNQVSHSFRVAAETRNEAEDKVRNHLWDSPAENLTIKARPAGKVAFYE
jgi:hypothetical protein